jgi:hypothetical protein
LDGNTRSSWDILWTCLSTILACTWAALHLNVPDRNWGKGAAGITKGLAWFGVILAPEVMALYAATDVCYARKLVARCNNSFVATRKKEKDAEKGEPEAGSRQLSEVEVEVEDENDRPWTLIQGFCIHMNGLQLQTKDDWAYTVGATNIVALIEAKVVRRSYLRKRDIDDRAKADVMAQNWIINECIVCYLM